MPDLDWFTEWAWALMSVTVTFVKGIDEEALAVALGASSMRLADAPQEDGAQADDHLEDRVRLGRSGEWVYAIEGTTTRGYTALESLSEGGGEACVFCYTQGIKFVLFATDGQTIAGLDLTIPHFRFGSDEHYLDAFLAEVGISNGASALPGQGARLIEVVCGIEITQEMLERPLPSLPLP